MTVGDVSLQVSFLVLNLKNVLHWLYEMGTHTGWCGPGVYEIDSNCLRGDAGFTDDPRSSCS